VTALWQRREGWAFAAGLGLNLTVSFVLWHGLRGVPLESRWVPLLQANLIATSAAALAWLAAGGRLYRGRRAEAASAPLLAVQVALALAGNAVLLARPAALLVLQPAAPGAYVAEVGTVWSWLALISGSAAAVWYAGRFLSRAVIHLRGALGLGLGVLAACTAARWWPADGNWLAFHTLTVGWALTGLVTLGAGPARSREVRRLAASVCGWVAAVSALLVGLALRSAAADPAAPWWPAAVVLVAAGLVAGVALWQRREGWAFAAGLSLNLAVSLVLIHFRVGDPFGEWWVYFVQANTIAASLAGLLWLAASRRLYGAGRPALASAPLLAVQVAAAVAGSAVPVVVAAGLLIVRPERLAESVLQTGQASGWLAPGLALAAAAWLFGRRYERGRLHALGCLGLALAVQAAATVGAYAHDSWLAYRVLTGGWVAAGMAVLAAGWLGSRRRDEADPEGGRDPFPLMLVRAWVGALGLLAVGLALRGFGADPAGAVWSVGAVAAVGVTVGLTALWARREDWAFAAGLLFNLAVSLAVWEAHRGEHLVDWWVSLVRANVLTWAAVALGWLALARQLYGRRGLGSAPLLSVQVVLGLAGNVALLVGPLAWLVIDPGDPVRSVQQAGELPGWLCLLAALAAAVWHVGRTPARGGAHVLCLLGLGVGVLAACTVARISPHGWLAYHTLLFTWALAGTLTLAVGWRITARFQREVALPQAVAALRGWVVVIGSWIVALALRSLALDPTGPYWSAAALVVVSALAGALGVWSGGQLHVYVSGLLFTLAGTALRGAWGEPWELVTVAALGLALASALWSTLEGPLGIRVAWPDAFEGQLPFRRVAAVTAVGAAVLLAGTSVAVEFGGLAGHVNSPLTGPMLAAVALALAAGLRDPGARFSLAGFYLLGLSALALALHALAPAPRWLGGPLLSAYVLTAALLWHVGRSGRLAEALRRSGPLDGWAGAWFGPAQLALAGAALALSVWTCLAFPTLAQRQMGPLAVALLLPAALLALRTGERWRSAPRYAVLALAALLAVEGGWAWLGADTPLPWLHRSGLVLAVSATLTLVYGVLLARRLSEESGWAGAARHSGAALGALSLAVLAAVLAQEVMLFRPGLPALHPLPGEAFVIAGAVAVVLMLLTALCLAVVPGLDPLGLSERGRTAYVYAGEVLLVLAFAHLRLTAPELFGGRLARYWPFLVVGVAFLGAAVGELFRRLRLRVLAEPLERTGVLLPMLPVAAFWLQPASEYTLLWFTVSLLYVFLSVTRRSLAFLLLATAAANVGLWLVLHQNQLAFMRYPQLWLIPLALSVLGAEHLNRDRLTRGQRNAIRYLALSAIYVSSTAETFLAGLGQDALRPAALVGLSVLGVLVGMLLRVRAFLFLGSGFLLLGLFAVIRHAAVAAEDRGRVVWLVAGIVLGAAIFTLFAVFEKRRNDVMRLLHRLKDWE
jgi:hypothetical protein